MKIKRSSSSFVQLPTASPQLARSAMLGYACLLLTLHQGRGCSNFALQCDIHAIKCFYSTASNSTRSRRAIKKTPSRPWHSSKSRRQYLDFLQERLKNKDLYACSQRTFLQQGGRGLLEYVRCEYQTLIMVEYPEVAWEPWKFVKSPNGWWLSVSRLFNAGDVVARTAVLVYFEHISKMHGITNLQEWREMRAELMNETEKRRISFLGKLPDVVESLYGGQISAGNLSMHRFQDMQEKGIRTAIKRRRYLESIACSMANKFSNDKLESSLYEIGKSELIRGGASSLLQLFGGSSVTAVMVEFPEIAWKPWRFKNTPQSWWRELGVAFSLDDPVAHTAVTNYMEEVMQRLHVEEPTDWYNVTNKALGPSTIRHLRHLGGLRRCLERLYPGSNLDYSQVQSNTNTSKTQTAVLKQIVTTSRVLLNNYPS